MENHYTLIENINNKFIGKVFKKIDNQLLYTTSELETSEEATFLVNNFLKTVSTVPKRCCGR